MIEETVLDDPGAACLAGGGEMGALMRALDWSKTPLGPVEKWSPSLRMMASFLLANRFPLLLWWGPEFCQLYNDAYRPVLGTKHPKSLGQPAGECWAEIWHIIGPLVETPFNGGPATWMEDIFLEPNRHGFVEETHFTIAYSPVPDETAPRGIGGVLATVHEITEKVVGERRLAALRDLGARAMEAKTAEEACAAAASVLAINAKDVPFALLYLIEGEGKRARLAGAAGIAPDTAASPGVVELSEDAEAPGWPLAAAVRQDAMVAVEDLAERFGPLPCGPWAEPPRRAVIVPVRSNIAHQLNGVLVAAVSPRLRLDDLYRSFFELAAAQIATSIANARAYEEERRRAEALAEIDRAKTAFFSNVSHEFRTPLSLMLGPLEEALAAPAETLPERRDDLALVHRNGLRLLRLVNTLLDFSRIEAGRVQASYTPVDLASLTTELASVFRSATARAGLALEIDCPPLAEPVWVDQDMWEKIVLNLLSNAFKFTLEGGITVRLRQDGRRVRLAVEDTGTGIPAQELPRLFDRFHRVEGARGRTHEGTGIGLALVQELVKLHGGEARAGSVLGQGSTFTVTLPLGTAHLPAERLGAERTLSSTALGAQPYVEEALRWLPEEAGAPADEIERELVPELPWGDAGGGMRARVLLADDNADMRDYLGRLLSRRYEVRIAADGAEALSLLRSNRPDLLLCDVMMPRLDGFALLREIRADPALAGLPVILLSARAGEEASIEGLEAGADDYLVKPFSARELLARVGANLKMARLRGEFERRLGADLRAMTRLHEIGLRCLRADAEERECLAEILDAAIEISGAEKGVVQLMDPETDTLEIAVQRGFDPAFLGFFRRVTREGTGVAATALRSRARVLVEDAEKSPLFADAGAAAAMRATGMRAVQATPLVSSAGKILGLLSTHWREPHRTSERELRLIDLVARHAADYLERRQGEAALSRLKDQLQAIFEGSPMGVYMADDQLRVRQINPAALPVFGRIDDPIGRDLGEVLHVLWPQAYADEVMGCFRHTLATGEPHHMAERAMVRRDLGVLEYYEWRIDRVPLEGGRYGVVCCFRDISAQVLARDTITQSERRLRELNDSLERLVQERSRALEEEMAEKQRVQAALDQAQRLESIGRLTGGIAHDFNNLLTVVIAQAESIGMVTRDERVTRMAAAAQRAAERGAQLTNQLLSFSGRQQLRPVTLATDTLIRGVGDLVRRTIGEEITVEIAAGPELWPVHVDPVQFEAAVLNLAINARDAMTGGGRLTISGRNERVAGAQAERLGLRPGSYIVTSVSDTGTGMSADVQRLAFEPFFTTKDVGKGTGLGLSQVYGFVRQSGGTAAIESAPGAGTRVSLYLPRAEAAAASQPAPVEARRRLHNGAGKTILIVEDQADVRDIIEMTLEDAGYRIRTARDGVAARSILQSEESIDLLLTDVVLPNGVNGLDLAQSARRLRQDLKIVVMSGYLRELGERDLAGLTFLEKPFRQSDLAATVAAAISG